MNYRENARIIEKYTEPIKKAISKYVKHNKWSGSQYRRYNRIFDYLCDNYIIPEMKKKERPKVGAFGLLHIYFKTYMEKVPPYKREILPPIKD
jgi:hypothetical protein